MPFRADITGNYDRHRRGWWWWRSPVTRIGLQKLSLSFSLSLSVFFFSFRLFLFLSLLSVSAARQLLASATNVDTTYTGDLEPRSTVHAYMRADCVTSLSCVTSLWECGCPWFPADFHITNAKLACAWYGCPKQIRR